MALHPEEMPYISVCSGGGGLDAGVRLAIPGARAVCYVEREAPAVAALVAGMEAGALDEAPVWSDAATFDGTPWRGKVAGVVGGTPCQDLSLAGKRAGLHGERSGLFFEFVRILRECDADWGIWENVGGATSALPAVCAQFEAAGYRGAWVRVQASDVGSTHRRTRIFLLAYRDGPALGEQQGWSGWMGGTRAALAGLAGSAGDGDALADCPSIGWGAWWPGTAGLGGRHDAHECGGGSLSLWPPGPADADGWSAVLKRWPHLTPALPQPSLRRVVDGLEVVAGGVDRIEALRLLGNGVVPEQAAHAIRGLVRALLHSSSD